MAGCKLIEIKPHKREEAKSGRASGGITIWFKHDLKLKINMIKDSKKLFMGRTDKHLHISSSFVLHIYSTCKLSIF